MNIPNFFVILRSSMSATYLTHLLVDLFSPFALFVLSSLFKAIQGEQVKIYNIAELNLTHKIESKKFRSKADKKKKLKNKGKLPVHPWFYNAAVDLHFIGIAFMTSLIINENTKSGIHYIAVFNLFIMLIGGFSSYFIIKHINSEYRDMFWLRLPILFCIFSFATVCVMFSGLLTGGWLNGYYIK